MRRRNPNRPTSDVDFVKDPAGYYGEIYRDDPVYRMREWRQSVVEQMLRKYVPPNCRSILDVGCGRGESLKVGRALGFDTRGCEIVPALCDHVLVKHIPSATDLSIYGDGEFDVVTSWDVFEHLGELDVPAAIAECRRVAKHRMIMGIAQRPDIIGTHRTVESSDWWIERFVAQDLVVEEATGIKYPPVKNPYGLFVVTW